MNITDEANKMDELNRLSEMDVKQELTPFTFSPFIKLKKDVFDKYYFAIFNSDGTLLGFTPKFSSKESLNVFRLIRIQLDIYIHHHKNLITKDYTKYSRLHNLILLMEMDYGKLRNRDISKSEMSEFRLDELLDDLIEVGFV